MSTDVDTVLWSVSNLAVTPFSSTSEVLDAVLSLAQDILHTGTVFIGQADLAAGFLKIPGAENPLDRTWVHPESYSTAIKLLEKLGFTPEVVRDKAQLPALHAKLDELAQAGALPVARLKGNRRQLEPADRRALARWRAGDAPGSQALRGEHGWDHQGADPGRPRQAMADAVAADLLAHGPASTAALVVSHGQAEDLADRIRARLTASASVAPKGGPPPAPQPWLPATRARAASHPGEP